MLMDKIVITGSSGFIGTSLSKYLNGQYELILIDKSPSKIELNHATYILEDIRNIKKEMIDGCIGIIHLASVSRVIWGEENPMDTWSINVEGTQHIINVAQELSKKPWIIYGSSREIYGEPRNFPVTENHIWAPINRYGYSKLAAEGLVNLYGLNNNIPILILRFSNVYGNTFDQMDRVIPKFLTRAINNLDLELQGSDNSFDFTHIDDTVEAIYLAINYIQKLNEYSNSNISFNICTGIETNLRELANIILEITNSSSNILETHKRSYDVTKFRGSWKLANSILSYEPKVLLREGILQLYNLIQSELFKVIL